VSVTCPYCKNSIKLKAVKPGRFTPKCPKCAKTFLLKVPTDPAQSPVAEPYNPPASAPAAAASAPAPAPAKPAAEPTVVANVIPGLMETNLGAPAPVLEPTIGVAPAPAPVSGFDQTAAIAPAVPASPDVTAARASQAPSGGPATGGPGEGTEVFTPTPPPGGAAGMENTVALSTSGTGTGVGEHTEAEQVSQPKTQVDGMPSSLGGYSIVKLLGKGGMGAVYLARQVSLDRDVALKVMNPHWAKDPAFLARFTREAYAAAQLVHHNIVQIYDIGEEHDTPFFSMEFVKGKNLGEVTSAQGKLDVDEAVGYILQAARGLRFAHDQGMVHRDIKPDNLMLNEQGIVKVADLGLVKTAGSSAGEDQDGGESGRPASLTGLASLPSVTNVGVAMGTPSYMAPEQGRNAATVDHRADIYSLGCTLYVMLTGRPPFQGKSALEVMTKHLTEPVISPDVIAKRVPKNLSAIILKMLAKKPEDRYPDLGAVNVDLEKFLGITSAGPFTPKEEHSNALDVAVKQFNNAPAAKQRAIAVPSFFGILALLIFFCFVFRFPLWSLAVIGLGILTMVGTFLTSGVIYRTHLFVKAREMLLDSNWGERLRWGLYLVLFVGAIILAGPLVVTALVLLAAAICSLYHILIERKLIEERARALTKAETLLKQLRLRGLEEEALRQFVAKYSGDKWEELYEALFGYDLMIQARQRLAATEGGKRRAKHAAWRDPIIQWLEARQRQAREARERKHLQKIEQKRLEAEGVNRSEASSRAAAAADVLVDAAVDMKKANDAPNKPAVEGEPAAPPKPLFNAKKLMEAAAAAEKDHANRVKKRPNPLKMLYAVTIGPQPRFLLAAALIFGCSLWVYQNKDLQKKFSDMGRHGANDAEAPNLKDLASTETNPLNTLGMLPESVGRIFNSFNPGVAGILLIISAVWRSRAVTPFFFAAVAVLLFGPLMGIPSLPEVAVVGKISPEVVSLAIGLLLAILGVVADRIFLPDRPASRAW
jgi:eukaryotic-like serine/threonine-protein kinase